MPVGIIVSIFGLLGNAISILVWRRILKKNTAGNKSTGIYLLVLGIADSGLLVFFLLTDSLPVSFPSVSSTAPFCFFYAYIGFPLFFFFIAVSIWLVVGVTLNRFLMVLFPIKSKKWCSKSRAYLGIIIISVCCFIINVPHFFNFRPQETNGTYSIAQTEYAASGGSKNYEFWVHCMFLVLAPWASIAFFNGGIIYSLMKRANAIKAKFGESKNKEREAKDKQMTVMLLTVTFSFLILLAFQCITQCFYMLKFGSGTSKWDLVDKSYAFAKMGVVFYSAINFVLYCCTGTQFRKELMSMFRRGGRARYLSNTRSTGSATALTVTHSPMIDSQH